MSEIRSFAERFGLTDEDSTPWWPEPTRPPNGAPNVLYIRVLDDVGFGHLGCYGGAVDTPNINKLGREWFEIHRFSHNRSLLSNSLMPLNRS